MLRFTILASGSTGNCAYLETEETRVLIDAGLSRRQIEERLRELGRELSDVQAIFLTHEHSDHVSGLPVLARRHNIPIYCNRLTAANVDSSLADYQNWRFFETGQTVQHGDLAVETFPIPHDAYDPVGFVFCHALGNLGFLTDLGHATQLAIERVRKSRALVLESNHCVKMLQADPRRPWALKQRILSRHGHLSNDAAAAVAAELAPGGIEDIYLGHLSAECNIPALARKTVQDRLDQDGGSTVRLHETAPNSSCETLEWK